MTQKLAEKLERAIHGLSVNDPHFNVKLTAYKGLRSSLIYMEAGANEGGKEGLRKMVEGSRMARYFIGEKDLTKISSEIERIAQVYESGFN